LRIAYLGDSVDYQQLQRRRNPAMGTEHVAPRVNTGNIATALMEGTCESTDLDAKQYLSTQIERLEELVQISEIARDRLTDDDLFKTVIKETVNRTDQYPPQLAETLRVSNSTMSRWMNGITAPHPTKKPDIYKRIKAVCARELRSFRKQLEA
jgi:hypothetical protein